MRPPPFQRFLDEHRDDVFRFLVAAVGRDDADDCFQETFLSALRAYPKLRDASNLRAWVFTIATRKAADAGRARARRPIAVEVVPDIGSSEREPSDERLWAAVGALPDKQRTAVLHRFVNDLAYGEIAKILSCSEDAARQNVSEGLRRLRTTWHG